MTNILDAQPGTAFIVDTECYPNFWYCAFLNVLTGETFEFELSPWAQLDKDALQRAMFLYLTIGFNSNSYDMLMIESALQGIDNAALHKRSAAIVEGGMNRFAFEQEYRITRRPYNHIDLIEVCPLKASLKMYAARLHFDRIQDLPYHPHEELTESMAFDVRDYCKNSDCPATRHILRELDSEMALRYSMSAQYGTDLRSKSDAQIAESVICSQIKKRAGFWPKRPELSPAFSFRYTPPEYLKFTNSELSALVSNFDNIEFSLDAGGSPRLPPEIEGKTVNIGMCDYRMGIGGLHSSEKSRYWEANDECELTDIDVTSFYPKIILNQKLTPTHLAPHFLPIFESIVNDRIAAKKRGDDTVANSLKITINGSFGKFGSKWSAIYSPDLMVQVTLTGQLSLLLLIERLELVGLSVVSANTDGIVIFHKKSRRAELESIVKKWEQDTDFQMEYTNYQKLASRDVNNYLAIKSKGVKGKGVFSNPWTDPKLAIFRFHKNPSMTVTIEAVANYLEFGKPIAETINECDDIRKFVTVRDVKGGATKDGFQVGKVVRYYYRRGELSALRYKISGNLVPLSEGAWPVMNFNGDYSIPDNLDRERYIKIAESLLADCGIVGSEYVGNLF